MSFSSIPFIYLFLPFCVFAFFFVSAFKNRTLSLSFFVALSLTFYGYYDWRYIFLLLFSIFVNYAVSVCIFRCDKEKYGKILTGLGIAFNIALMGYFKYTGFFLENVNALFGANFSIWKIIPPLGISFFSFQQISYLVDTYRGTTKKNSFLEYLCFVSFFPQILSGPISRYGQLMPQIDGSSGNAGMFSFGNVGTGIIIFAVGLFKKVVFADYCGEIADPLFNATAAGYSLTCSESWEAAVSYSLQLYFDFSGYCDMAVGCAKMLGFSLPVNFDSPYKSKSITEFWRRWHMTLSFFLRDYLYIPMGGNRNGKLRKHFNLLATMLIGGLWHGAAWTFVAWGGMHGLMLVINNIFRDFLKKQGVDNIRNFAPYKCLSVILTFVCVAMAWVFFRAESFQSAWTIISGMFNPSLGFAQNRYFDLNQFSLFGLKTPLGFQHLMMVFLFAVCLFAKNSVFIQSVVETFDRRGFKFCALVGGALVMIFFCSLILLGRTGNNSFIYFNF